MASDHFDWQLPAVCVTHEEQLRLAQAEAEREERRAAEEVED